MNSNTYYVAIHVSVGIEGNICFKNTYRQQEYDRNKMQEGDKLNNNTIN